MEILPQKKVVLLILDGWGYAPPWGGNAISIAKTPNFDHLWRYYPHTIIGASGVSVGLPGHERGNSEVGHLNLGAGLIPLQDSNRINESINDGSIFNNHVILETINYAKHKNSNLHIMGLVSNGNIHSHINHLFALLDICKKQDFKNVYIHGFSDGRDSNPMAAQTFFAQLENKLKEIGFGKIATISGRYYAMDRDNHWERTELAYNAMVQGRGNFAPSVLKAIASSYQAGINDEYIKPTVILDDSNKPISTIKDNDSMIFFNFRADRARQIAMAFMSENMPYFHRQKINNLFFVGMIPYGYEEELKLNLLSAFKTEKINNPIARVLSENNLKQLHIAETEKYAHVTYFFNGGEEKPFLDEDRVLIASPRISSYALKPEMSVYSITEQVLIKLRNYNFIVINFANGDMVGHTGDFGATVKACEVVDVCLGKVFNEVLNLNGTLIVTADHGNCEEMINIKTGEPHTEHTNNPVPFLIIGQQFKNITNIGQYLRPNGILADVSPVLIFIMGLSKPMDMTGNSIIFNNK
ncbi:MAG: 2,3-bisphosphoglycerate-independent phosphoglycerate mutase [Patescibacteria group bacterium]|nr:2,3-bisphosphoglycerate-independent phosphoglycerate mutase [Patescibacteria group bacterium]